MQNSLSGEGWTNLNNISSFMSHNERRKHLNIFGSLDAELDYCEYLIRSEIHKADEPRFRNKKRKAELSPDMVNAFKSLSLEELILYYNVLVEQVVNLSNNIFKPPPLQNTSFLITQAYARSYTLKIWKRKKLRFDRQNHIIYAEKDKKIKIYDLGNYILRKSNSTNLICLVLEAINDIPLEKSKTVHFGFEYKNTFSLWFNTIRVSTCYRQWERVGSFLHKTDEMLKYRQMQEQSQMDASIFNNTGSKNESTSQTVFKEPNQSHHFGHLSLPFPIKEVEEANFLHEKVVSKENFLYQKLSNDSGLIHSIDTEKAQSPMQPLNWAQFIKNSFAYRLLHEDTDITMEELQCQLQKESEANKTLKKKVPIHQILLQDYTIHEASSLQQFNELTLFFNVSSPFVGEISVYSRLQTKTHFKFVYLSPFGSAEQSFNKQSLLKKLLDTNPMGSINKNIRKRQIKAVLLSQNCTINREEHLPFNRLFRPRQFVYLRHLFKTEKDEYFIIDKSIDQPMFPTEENIVRGNILSIIKIQQNHHHIKLTIDLRMSNNGDLTEGQEIAHTKRYMNNLALGLSQYFSSTQSESAKCTIYDFDLISQEEPEIMASLAATVKAQGANTSTTPNLPLQLSSVQSQNKISDNSVIRIPKATELIEKDRYMESMHVCQKEDHRSTDEYVRRTYQPPRKINNNYLNPHLSFMEAKEEECFDWKFQIVPEWTIDWVVDQQFGGLIYKAHQLKQKQLKRILQYTSRASLSNSACSKVSFPVDILAPESKLERLTKALSYAPFVFDLSSELNTLNKFKKTVVFGILSSLLSIKVNKEFDPILGQTYQGEIPSSCKTYAEQISPSQTAIFLAGKEFFIHAIIEPKLKLLMNCAAGEHSGVYKVCFKDQTEVCFTTPPGELTGLVYSTPTFRLLGKSYYWNKQQCLLLELNFEVSHSFSLSPNAKTDSFQGFIYQVTPAFMEQFIKHGGQPNEEDIVRKVEKVWGRWTKFVHFQQERVDFEKIPLYQMNNEHNSLPSDSSFRQDINSLKTGNMENAQAKRQALQDQERYDEKLRERTEGI